MQKNNVQTYTIREAAKLSGLSESTLRFYETIGLIHPITRDESSKHRVYTEDDVNLVISVACLNATGLSIEDMRTYLKNRSIGSHAANEQIKLLEKQKLHLVEKAHYEELRQRYVDIKIAYWNAVSLDDRKQIEETKKQASAIAKELKLPHELPFSQRTS